MNYGAFSVDLQKSPWFSVLLYVGVTSSVVFFFTVGGYNTDIKFWNWTDDFTLRSWGCVSNQIRANPYNTIRDKGRKLNIHFGLDHYR